LAVAAVTDIALNARRLPVAAKALAMRHGLSPRHLDPVLHALVRHGILKGTRGPRGGYELAREKRCMPMIYCAPPARPSKAVRESFLGRTGTAVLASCRIKREKGSLPC
jgi:hypothetical protein